MLVVVKAPHTEFKIEGNIPEKYIREFKADFGKNVTVVNEDEPISFRNTEFFETVFKNKRAGIRLKTYRKIHRLTQKQLAEKLHTTKQRISNLETGSNPISLSMARQFSELFDAPLVDFLE